MMTKTMTFFFLLSCLALETSYAQVMDEAVKSKFDRYLNDNLQEKLFVHTDKDSYLAGEIIWFKIYATEAYTHRPVNISKVAYLEIIDETKKPVLQLKIELKENGGSGALYIPVSLSSGIYTLRCYTNWMKNYDADFFFHKALPIFNTLKEEPVPPHKIEVSPSYAVQFFPEGGNLIAGFLNKVAFKAVNEHGKSFDFHAVIVNSRLDTILQLHEHHLGIGSFVFKPESGETYQALVKPASAKSFKMALPPVLQRGVVMAVKNKPDANLEVNFQSNLESAGNFTLLVHSGNKMVFNENFDLGSGKKIVHIPLEILGDGISHLTLFNPDGKAISERLYFKRPSSLLYLNVSADKATYKTREKVKLRVSQKTGDLPEAGVFSISVYQADSISNEDDIAANLWLSSELRGKIEQASWYLKKGSPEELDNLMLTHGWRRFKWEDILEGKQRPLRYLPEVKGHIVSGSTTNSNAGETTQNKIAFLSVPGSRYQLYTATSNASGRFNFHTKNFYGVNEIIVQTDRRIDSLSDFQIHSPFSDKFEDIPSYPNISFLNNQELRKRSVFMQVNNAYQAKNLNREIIQNRDSSFFYLRPDKVYNLKDYVRFTTMEEVLREYVPEITVTFRKGDYQLHIFDSSISQIYDTAPFMMIDGVPIFDEGNTITKVDPRKIERIEIVSGSYSYGRSLFQGIASFHTYKGDLGGYRLPGKVQVLDYEGLQNSREFYSPMYEGDEPGMSRIPDYRSTLFWSSNNLSSPSGETLMNFYTSDVDGKYVIKIHSLTAEGKAGSATTTFSVAPAARTK
jgi:hypothetical protein